MEPGEQLKAIVEESFSSGIGSSVILVGPHGCGKTFNIRKLLSTFDGSQVVHFPGALARPTLCPDPQNTLLSLLPPLSSCACVETLEEYFMNRKELLFLVMEDLDLFGGGVSEQAFLYSIFELTLSHPLVILATTCRQDFMELFEKRVKSRFGYNIISLPMPSFEEFKQRTTELKSEEEMKRRYMVSTDPRLSLPSKIELEDLCLSETLVLACILKTRTDQMVTPQMVFREYLHTVKPQLEAMSMVRPLTIGQFCRAFESLVSKGLLVDRKEGAVGDFMLRTFNLVMPGFWLQDILQTSEPFVQRILQN